MKADREREDDLEMRNPKRLDERGETLPVAGKGCNDDDADLTAIDTAIDEALASYRAESLDWAEQRSARMPSPLPAGSRTHVPAWLRAPQWVLGTVALCGCVMGGAVYAHHQATLAEDAAMALPAAPTNQALAADNELLSSVDHALSGPVTPTEQELGLTDGSLGERAQMRRHAQPSSN